MEMHLGLPGQVSRERSFTRGISPSCLLDHVRNTIPFLFSESKELAWYDGYAYLAHLRRAQVKLTDELSHEDYFTLCLCAHHATVASFVPTDVDSQIRFKLWHPSVPIGTMRAMATTVMQSHDWDWTPVSARFARSPHSGEAMSGHNGEWFSTAAAAYCALRRRDSQAAAEIAGAIVREARRELGIFRDLHGNRDGIGLMKAATVIAHNFGDLQRVFDLWNLSTEDPLVNTVEKTKTAPEWAWASELNRRWTANENHRHFALRAPRCLRRAPELLLPLGPFFDAWGTRVATELTPEEVGEVVHALLDGWQWLEAKVIGYARALAGIEEGFPGGLRSLSANLPVRVAREWKSGPLRTACSIARRRFEEQWKQMALNACR